VTDLRCPHLPSARGAVLRVTLECVAVPGRRDPEPWSALICAQCAVRVRELAGPPPTGQLAPPWHITAHAAERYMHARRWPDTEASYQRALDELGELHEHATYRETDAHGRELWRSSPRHGGLRWVVVAATRRGDLPSVVWVGQGRPPASAWEGP
jgi:hypothetical protein